MFSVGAPSAEATVLAREVIQNSWDAAIELREGLEGAPPFEMRFSFGSALAERKRQLDRVLFNSAGSGTVRRLTVARKGAYSEGVVGAGIVVKGRLDERTRRLPARQCSCLGLAVRRESPA